MTAHTHQQLVRACFRCELSIDELRNIKRRDYTRTTRLWGKCEGCGYKWQWSGATESVWEGFRLIRSSSCRCTDAWRADR